MCGKGNLLEIRKKLKFRLMEIYNRSSCIRFHPIEDSKATQVRGLKFKY